MPGKFITSHEFTDELGYRGTFDADGVEVPEMWDEAYDPQSASEVVDELTPLADATL